MLDIIDIRYATRANAFQTTEDIQLASCRSSVILLCVFFARKRSEMSKKSKDEEFVKKYLLSHEEFTNGFVLEWIRTHPDLLKQQPKSTLGVSTLTPRPVSMGGGNLVKQLSKSNYSTANLGFQRKNTAELRKLSKRELFMELLRDVVTPDFNADRLSHKILVNVILLVNADKSSLFLMEGSEDNPVLISRLFDVTENSTVEEAIHDDNEAITIPVGVGIAGQAAQTGTIINIEDAYKVGLKNNGWGWKDGWGSCS